MRRLLLVLATVAVATPTARAADPDPALLQLGDRVEIDATGQLRLAVACPPTGRATCRGTLTFGVRQAGRRRTLGRASYSLERGGAQIAQLRLRPADRRRLHGVRHLPVRVDVRPDTGDPFGRNVPMRSTL